VLLRLAYVLDTRADETGPSAAWVARRKSWWRGDKLYAPLLQKDTFVSVPG